MGNSSVQAIWDDVFARFRPINAKRVRSSTTRQRRNLSGSTEANNMVVPDFEIPEHYPQAYGLDMGWNRTAAIWGARDNETGVIYLYSEHYMGQQEPVLHAQAIKSRGSWRFDSPGSAGPQPN